MRITIVWFGSSSLQDPYPGAVQGQRYASDGSPLGAEFGVNSYTTGGQAYPALAMAPDGDFVVAWSSNLSEGTDTSESSIQGQRFGTLPAAVPALSAPMQAALAAALLLLGSAYAWRRRR